VAEGGEKMKSILISLIIVVIVVLFFWTGKNARNEGYKQGYSKGYEIGFASGDSSTESHWIQAKWAVKNRDLYVQVKDGDSSLVYKFQGR
jgi:hypothetical protein